MTSPLRLYMNQNPPAATGTSPIARIEVATEGATLDEAGVVAEQEQGLGGTAVGGGHIDPGTVNEVRDGIHCSNFLSSFDGLIIPDI